MKKFTILFIGGIKCVVDVVVCADAIVDAIADVIADAAAVGGD